MIVPDVNLLVYAHNAASRFHDDSHDWWEACLNGSRTILLPHLCVNGFIRIMTHPRILVEPLSVAESLAMVDSWLVSDLVLLVAPGERHYAIYKRLLLAAGVGGKLSTDAHLAALAIENRATLYSNDHDFVRFPGLAWVNPLTPAG
jgi:hypothetical protein